MKFWADENFNGVILKGLLRLYPHLDIIRVQDTPLISMKDPDLLEEASLAGAILLTHDTKTIPPFANERIANGQLVVGVIAIPQSMAIGQAIEELAILIGAGTDQDFVNRVYRLPM